MNYNLKISLEDYDPPVRSGSKGITIEELPGYHSTTNVEFYPNGYPQVQLDKEKYERELRERQEKHLKRFEKPWQPCLHDQCRSCHGTGIDKFGGTCIHMISCSCPKCSPTF